jgi:murein hydrolase activator
MARPTRRRPRSIPRTRIGQCYNFVVTITPLKLIRTLAAARTEFAEKRLLSGFSAVFAVIVLSLAVSVLAQQDDRARTEALATRASDRLQALHREADQLAAEERTLLGDLRKLEIERQIKVQELRQLDTDAAAVERELAETTGRLTKLQDEVVAARPDLEARLIEMYKLGQARYARLLLSTSDVRRLGQAARTAAALAKLDRDRVISHQQTLEGLASVRATLEARNRRLATLRAEARRAESEVARAALARTNTIRDIDRQRDLNAQLAGELQAAQQKLQSALRTMSTGATAAVPATLPFKPFRADLDWPTAGTVRRRFVRPVAGRPAVSNGIEIAALEGAAVSAVHGGVVAFADAFSGFGNLVILDHGAQSFTLYGNLLDIGVKKGAMVDAGQPLGTVGATVAGPAGLYFEMRVDGQPVDPLQWLRKK